MYYTVNYGQIHLPTPKTWRKTRNWQLAAGQLFVWISLCPIITKTEFFFPAHSLESSTCEPTGRSETCRVSDHWALDYPGAWDSTAVKAEFRLIERQCGGLQWTQSDNSLQQSCWIHFSSSSWSEHRSCILFAQFCFGSPNKPEHWAGIQQEQGMVGLKALFPSIPDWGIWIYAVDWKETSKAEYRAENLQKTWLCIKLIWFSFARQLEQLL